MNSVVRNNKFSQASLLVVAFSTPFAVMNGTGGYPQAQRVETTGNSIFVIGANQPTNEEKTVAYLKNRLQSLMQEYVLEKNQTAKLLNVSRPTLNSWLEGKSNKIRVQNSNRLNEILDSLEENTSPHLRPLTGQFLNRKLDTTVRSLYSIVTQEHITKNELRPIMRSMNFKLAGIEKSTRLQQSLSNKKPLV
jgi:predicted transcriptional regulator